MSSRPGLLPSAPTTTTSTTTNQTTLNVTDPTSSPKTIYIGGKNHNFNTTNLAGLPWSFDEETPHMFRKHVLIGSLIALIVVSGLFMCARFFIQWRFRKQQGWDGPVLIFSWLSLLVAAALVFPAIGLGLGHHLSEVIREDQIAAMKYISISQFLTVVATATCKCAVAGTLLRFAKEVWQRSVIFLFAMSVLSAQILWGVFILFACNPVTGRIKVTCLDNSIEIWGAFGVTVWAAFTDFALVWLGCWMVYDIRLSRKDKVMTVVAVWLGILPAICAVCKAKSILEMQFPTDFTYQVVPFLIWNIGEAATLIVTASVPYFKPALEHLSKHLGGQTTAQDDEPGTPGLAIALRRRSLLPRSPAHAPQPSTSSSDSPLWEVASLDSPDGNTLSHSETVGGGGDETLDKTEEVKGKER